MKRSHKTAGGIVAALSLGVAVAASAQPGSMGDGNGAHGKSGMQHSKMGGMQHGAMGHGAAGMGAGHSLMTPEERHKLAQANREEMQKRAQEKGMTLPQSDTHTH
jgi:hypothetical protein